MKRMFRKGCQGQSMTEYVVVCAALAMALGIGMVDDQSVLWQLLQAFQLGYKKYSFALSIPT
ncbi:MAG: hypothetical protein KGP14_14835 [Betaproteobacteria bacterium]|nr:hypothetical protein [Betaproteobacteria bacterium]